LLVIAASDRDNDHYRIPFDNQRQAASISGDILTDLKIVDIVA